MLNGDGRICLGEESSARRSNGITPLLQHCSAGASVLLSLLPGFLRHGQKSQCRSRRLLSWNEAKSTRKVDRSGKQEDKPIGSEDETNQCDFAVALTSKWLEIHQVCFVL